MANVKISLLPSQNDILQVDGLAGYDSSGTIKISGTDLRDSLLQPVSGNLQIRPQAGTIVLGLSGQGIDINGNTQVNGSLNLNVDSNTYGTIATSSFTSVSFNGTAGATSTGYAVRLSGPVADSINAVGTSGQVLSSTGSGTQWVTGGTNSYMLTGIIEGLGSSAFDFTYFGSTLTGITDQGSGFSVFVNSELTHVGFKYLSDDVLVSSTDSYEINVYESNASFDTLPADTIASFTSLLTTITITGDNVGGSNYGTYPFASIALGAPITLTAGKFYAIVGERSGAGGGLFNSDEEGQITLRITE